MDWFPGDPAAQYNPTTGKAAFVLPVTGWSSNTILPNPYMEQYSLSLAAALFGDMAIEASYIGQRRDGNYRSGIQYNPAVYGAGATLANQEQRRRYNPGQVGSMIRIEDGGNSSYNALTVILRKRFSRSLLFDVTIRWPGHLTYNRNRPHRRFRIRTIFTATGHFPTSSANMSFTASRYGRFRLG